MTQISNIHDIEKIVGDMLVKQSKLDRSRIMNGLSPRGIDLSKFVTENVKLSYDLSDTAIIFEVKSVENENINLTEIDEDNIREDACFEVSVTIYGNESMRMGQLLKARFESEKVRYDLLMTGLYLVAVSSTTSMNEFVNNTIWPRTDLSLKIACEMTMKQVDTMQQITTVNGIDIDSNSSR
jgi:hypothetical protein